MHEVAQPTVTVDCPTPVTLPPAVVTITLSEDDARMVALLLDRAWSTRDHMIESLQDLRESAGVARDAHTNVSIVAPRIRAALEGREL